MSRLTIWPVKNPSIGFFKVTGGETGRLQNSFSRDYGTYKLISRCCDVLQSAVRLWRCWICFMFIGISIHFCPTGSLLGCLCVHRRRDIDKTAPCARLKRDSMETVDNAGGDLSEICNGVRILDPTGLGHRLGLHGIAVYNKSNHTWTAYIWDGTKFFRDDSVNTPENAGADFLEIRNGVCLPDPTKLGLRGINFYKRMGRWTAHIWDGKQVYIGSYASASEAAKAYDKASLKHLDAAAALPNYRGIYDYSGDIREMATLTNEDYRELLRERARLSEHVDVEEGVTRCPEGRFEVRIKLQAGDNWKFLGRFDHLEDAKRWYQMVSRWYQRQANSV